MKIAEIETLRLAELANLLWVKVHSDQGIYGLRETFMSPTPVEAHIDETFAPYFTGKDSKQIDLHWKICTSIWVSEALARKYAPYQRLISRCGTFGKFH